MNSLRQEHTGRWTKWLVFWMWRNIKGPVVISWIIFKYKRASMDPWDWYEARMLTNLYWQGAYICIPKRSLSINTAGNGHGASPLNIQGCCSWAFWFMRMDYIIISESMNKGISSASIKEENDVQYRLMMSILRCMNQRF